MAKKVGKKNPFKGRVDYRGKLYKEGFIGPVRARGEHPAKVYESGFIGPIPEGSTRARKPRKPRKAATPKRKPAARKSPKRAARRAAPKRKAAGRTGRHSVRVPAHGSKHFCHTCGRVHGLREHHSHAMGGHSWGRHTEHSYHGLAPLPKKRKTAKKRKAKKHEGEIRSYGQACKALAVRKAARTLATCGKKLAHRRKH